MGEIAINPIHNVHKKYRTMNLVNPYIFTPPITYNTYIGGVSATISTAALLATKLGISVGAISNFTVVGSDIKCKITGSYSIPSVAFDADTSISYYTDSDNLVTDVGSAAFRNTVNLRELIFNGIITLSGNTIIQGSIVTSVELRNCTNISQSAFFNANYLNFCYIPACTVLGATVGNDAVFQMVAAGCKVYVSPVLATVNSGSPDGDLSVVTPIYVNNFTAPSAVTTLSAVTSYNTAIQLNFTPPSSTNAIDYYEVYINGVYNNKITSSGEYATGLTASTSYSITVYARDIFYNKSLVSNSIPQSTSSTNVIATETTSFENRVVSDGGVLIDKPFINEEFIKIISAGNLHLNLLFWHNYKSGLKKDGSNLVEKMHSFSGSNTDIIQTTTANKPLYTTSGINFDLTDLLTKTLSTSITNKSFSIVWKLKATPGNYYPQISLSPGSWNGFQMHSESGGGIYAGITVANRFYLAAGSFLNNTDATYTFTYNSVSKIAKIYRNSTLLSSKTMVDPANFTALSIDAQGGTFYDSKMFNRDLSLAEITNIL